jgi:hypothetical protein
MARSFTFMDGDLASPKDRGATKSDHDYDVRQKNATLPIACTRMAVLHESRGGMPRGAGAHHHQRANGTRPRTPGPRNGWALLSDAELTEVSKSPDAAHRGSTNCAAPAAPAVSTPASGPTTISVTEIVPSV